MTPGARLAAAVELLGAVGAGDRPADRVVANYFVARRYAGAKDRRAIAALVFAVLRNRAALDWWTERGGGAPSPRARVLAALLLVDDKSPPEAAAGFDGGRYGPAPLDEDERALADRLAGQALRHPDQPPWVRCEVPEWLWLRIVTAFGGAAEAEFAALIPPAPVDLRVNALKAGRAAAKAALAEDGIEAEATAVSPLGLRLSGRRPLTSARAYRQGLVEVQDEGSQAVALLTDARPGMTVADVCAGAGGKSLALAAAMGGEGRLVALDLEGARLARAGPRLARAGVDWVELRAMDRVAILDADWPAGLAGRCDRVLVDAPCSGSGAWRRQPDARWRLTPEDLARYRTAQAEALNGAAALVAPGGRLVYATCSLLPEENGAQVAGFLAAHADFSALDPEPLWRATLGGPCPRHGNAVLLTPMGTGTDGFFVALLERRGGP